MKRARRPTRIDHEFGSGNVYADLACPDPQAMLIKARLVSRIAGILGARALTQTAAAALLGIPETRLADLLNGRFGGLSARRLGGFLARLEGR